MVSSCLAVWVSLRLWVRLLVWVEVAWCLVDLVVVWCLSWVRLLTRCADSDCSLAVDLIMFVMVMKTVGITATVMSSVSDFVTSRTTRNDYSLFSACRTSLMA